MTYGITPGQASTAAGAAAAKAPGKSVKKAQQEMFSIATNASKLVGPEVQRAQLYANYAVDLIKAAHTDLAVAENELVNALNEARAFSYWAKVLIVNLGYEELPYAEYTLARALPLVRAYKQDVYDAYSAAVSIRYNSLPGLSFKYRDTTVGKYDVRSCSNLRSFKYYADGAKPKLGDIYRALSKIRSTLYFYGSTAGKQRRNQTKQLIIDAKLAVNEAMTLLTRIARSGAAVRSIRALIDLQNDNAFCGGGRNKTRKADGSLRDMTNEEEAAYCHGLNNFAQIFRLVAAKQGRSWTNYRQRWNDLSNERKRTEIVNGLVMFREDVLRPLRNRKIPKAREKFEEAFAGMSDVINKRTANFTSAQRAAMGDLPRATLQLTDALNAVRQADAQANSLALPLALMGDLSPVQCQQGSGYAGIFGGDDGEPMNPMLAVGGGLVAGGAVAHFFPNLLR